MTNQFFPDAQLTDADVLSSWAGLRPLVANKNGGPSDISRSHEIVSPEPGWYDVTGGKLTTYRLMAEQTVNQVVQGLRRKVAPCRSASEPLLPPAETAGVSSILPPRFSQEVVEHYCAREWAVHLDDVMLRRAGWHYYERNPGALAEQAADWMAEALGWSQSERAAELARYRAARGQPSPVT